MESDPSACRGFGFYGSLSWCSTTFPEYRARQEHSNRTPHLAASVYVCQHSAPHPVALTVHFLRTPHRHTAQVPCPGMCGSPTAPALPATAPAASLRLRQGASSLNWELLFLTGAPRPWHRQRSPCLTPVETLRCICGRIGCACRVAREGLSSGTRGKVLLQFPPHLHRAAVCRALSLAAPMCSTRSRGLLTLYPADCKATHCTPPRTLQPKDTELGWDSL